MKIILTPLTDGKYPSYFDIKDILGKKAEISEGESFSRESGGGHWIVYGLSIAFGAGAVIVAGFLEGLGNDLYKKLKAKITEYVKKDPVFFIPQSVKKQGKEITITFRIGEEGGQSLISKNHVKVAMESLPSAMKRINKLAEVNLAKHLSGLYVFVNCKYSEKDKDWYIEDIMTYQ